MTKKELKRWMMYSILSLLCISFWSSTLFGQNNLSPSRRANQNYQAALNQLQLGHYDQATSLLQQAVLSDSNFAEAHQGLGDLYRRTKDYSTAIPHYRKVVALNPNLTAITWFGLGESLLLTGHYEEALAALRQYERRLPLHDEHSRKTSSKYIRDCLFSLEYFRQYRESDHEIPHNLGPGINSGDDEYFPKLTADGETMIFTRKSSGQENFYESTLMAGDNWSEASFLLGDVNSTRYNEGAHCISPDGKYLYFTGCNRPEGLGSCDIYVSRRNGNEWGTPHNLGPTINTPGWEAQPALSADGLTLYFVSNRPGGIGGYDIWRSQMQSDGHWGAAENLGPGINTSFDESAPFIHADNNTLYFSSNGWPGFGDKDIFRSTQDASGDWQTPVNMGYPINDHTEQSAWSVSMNGMQGFFSSRRRGGAGGLDIYRVVLTPENRPAHVAYIKGTVIDADSRERIPGAAVQITELQNNKQSFGARSDQEDGTFLAPMVFGHHYALHVEHPDYLFHSSHYSLQDTLDRTDAFELTVSMHRIKIGHTEILENVFFEVGQYKLLEESRTELAKLHMYLHNNPGVSIEIGGHTDSTGPEESNQLLSEQRASAVRDFLVEAGIEPGRILARGYASQKPVATNLTEEGRQKNRRTDFRIIKN